MSGNSICERLDKLSREGASLRELLRAAVDDLHESNAKFHGTGIYELLDDGTLRLGPFVGSPTDHVFITVGEGVCGSAIAEGRNRNVPDVSLEPNYLPCSTSTRSELVVLIQKAKRIFGQIDIDSNELDAFDRRSEKGVQKVANRLAETFARADEKADTWHRKRREQERQPARLT